MDIVERYDKIASLQSSVFKMIRSNDKKRYIDEQKLNNLKNNFAMTKNSYTPDIIKIQKYNLQYIFLFEQYNYNRLNLENEIEMIDAYDKRIKKLSEHLLTRKGNRLLDVKRTFYEFNSLVQQELVKKYKLKIESLKQSKIMSDRYDELLEYLKENDIQEYNEKLEFSYSKEEKEKIIQDIERLTNKELKIIDVLKNNHFEISDDLALSLELADRNILNVAAKLYPDLNEKTKENENKKRKAA